MWLQSGFRLAIVAGAVADDGGGGWQKAVAPVSRRVVGALYSAGNIRVPLEAPLIWANLGDHHLRSCIDPAGSGQKAKSKCGASMNLIAIAR